MFSPNLAGFLIIGLAWADLQEVKAMLAGLVSFEEIVRLIARAATASSLSTIDF